MSAKLQLIIIIIISIAVHFTFFGHPNETVFDEVHFGKFVSGYYTGEYYFDIHPPLGKLMIAGFAKIVDFRPEYNFTNIGKEFPDKKYIAIRFLPAVAGTLLPVIIYLLILELGMSRIGAFAGGLLVIFDNALLTQSRLILLDPFLLLFGFASLLFYFKYRHSLLATRYWLLTTVFAGLAVSIKWTGLSFLALPILIETFRGIIKLSFGSFMIRIRRGVFFLLIPLAIYFSVFALHFALLPKPGPGDTFMKRNFRENGVAKNIWDLNIEMYKSNQRISVSHPYSSQWYTWPLMSRPIYYWVDSNSSPQVKDRARIYFFGNPVVWWTSTVAIAAGLWTMAYGLWLKFRRHSELSSIVHSPLRFLFGGYFLNILPFIGVKRVMFLYHYLTALIFAIFILVYLIDRHHNSRKIFAGIVIASIVAFFFFAPLSYGLPLLERAYEARVWFASWK